MTKSELIEILSQKQKQLAYKDVELRFVALAVSPCIIVRHAWDVTRRPVIRLGWKRSTYPTLNQAKNCVSESMKVWGKWK